MGHRCRRRRGLAPALRCRLHHAHRRRRRATRAALLQRGGPPRVMRVPASAGEAVRALESAGGAKTDPVGQGTGPVLRPHPARRGSALERGTCSEFGTSPLDSPWGTTAGPCGGWERSLRRWHAPCTGPDGRRRPRRRTRGGLPCGGRGAGPGGALEDGRDVGQRHAHVPWRVRTAPSTPSSWGCPASRAPRTASPARATSRSPRPALSTRATRTSASPCT